MGAQTVVIGDQPSGQPDQGNHLNVDIGAARCYCFQCQLIEQIRPLERNGIALRFDCLFHLINFLLHFCDFSFGLLNSAPNPGCYPALTSRRAQPTYSAPPDQKPQHRLANADQFLLFAGGMFGFLVGKFALLFAQLGL